MNRRAFNALAAFSLGLPSLLARSARAAELSRTGDRGADADAALSADEIVARLAAFYEKAVTFKANFSEPSRLPPWRRTGSVIFERPGKMSWRYAGSGTRVVSDGARIKVYEAESGELYEHELAASLYPLVLAFLTPLTSLRQEFKFTKSDSNPTKPEHAHWLIGEPRQPSRVCKWIALDVDTRSFEVRRVQLRDLQGNRSLLNFAVSKLNPRVPAGEFALSAPRGSRSR